MNRKACIFGLAVLTLGALVGCSSGPSGSGSKKAAAPDRIQGKAQVLVESAGAADTAINAGGESSIYLWDGLVRYRLFLRTPVEVVHGNQYIAEGINAQKAIDEIGDPDNGKNGYPIQSSCLAVVNRVWGGLALDQIDLDATALRTAVQRHPARSVFLVTKLSPAPPEPADNTADRKKETAAGEKNAKEITAAADKQKALLIEGPIVQTAPLWEPAGKTVSCKVTIDTQGKIAELDTGMQLCESVPWAKFHYQPTVQGGKPVRVSTEVEVKFEARK